MCIKKKTTGYVLYKFIVIIMTNYPTLKQFNELKLDLKKKILTTCIHVSNYWSFFEEISHTNHST